jgi:hemolysin III
LESTKPGPLVQGLASGKGRSSEGAPQSARKPKPLARGVLHAMAALIAIPSVLLLAAHARPGAATTMAIFYGLSLVLVFGVSGLYHTPMWSLTARRRMRRLDHSMIYFLIAGSYVPFASVLTAVPRAIVMSISIGGGLIGLIKAHAWERAPRFLTTGFYVVIGWCIVPFFPQVYAYRVDAAQLLLLGGICYSAGAVVYWLRVPNPWPRVFGYHEVNHLIGLGGAVAHYVAIWRILG